MINSLLSFNSAWCKEGRLPIRWIIVKSGCSEWAGVIISCISPHSDMHEWEITTVCGTISSSALVRVRCHYLTDGEPTQHWGFLASEESTEVNDCIRGTGCLVPAAPGNLFRVDVVSDALNLWGYCLYLLPHSWFVFIFRALTVSNLDLIHSFVPEREII